MTDSRLCTVCKNPGVKKLLDGYLEAGMTGAGISRALGDLGLKVSADVVNGHKSHWAPPAEKPKGTRDKDFAILVRDKAIEQVEAGTLDLADKDLVAGINAGLKAQAIIDKREQKKTEQNFWVQLGAAMFGGGPPPLLEDGNTIEGTFEELPGE